MKIKALREMNLQGLKQEMLALLKEQFNLRVQKSSKQLTQTHQLKRVRRHVARILTVIREQERPA
jgi:large subunit ribosomal protein L29